MKTPVVIGDSRHYQGFSVVGPRRLELLTSCVSSHTKLIHTPTTAHPQDSGSSMVMSFARVSLPHLYAPGNTCISASFLEDEVTNEVTWCG